MKVVLEALEIHTESEEVNAGWTYSSARGEEFMKGVLAN